MQNIKKNAKALKIPRPPPAELPPTTVNSHPVNC